MSALNFNARTVQPSTGVAETIPAGWYNVMIDESEEKATSDGQGKYLNLRFTVLDGAHVNRKVFARLNIRNSNAQAQEIAYRDLSAICHAVAVFDLQDSQQLHGIPLKIRVSLSGPRPKKDAQGNATGEFYDPSNDVKAYRNINEVVDMAVASAPAGYAAPQGAPQGFAPPQQPQVPAGWGPAVAAPLQPAYTPPVQPQQPVYAAQPQQQQPQQQPQQPAYAPPQQQPAQPWAAQAPAQAAPPQYAPAGPVATPWGGPAAAPVQAAPVQTPPAGVPPQGSQPWNNAAQATPPWQAQPGQPQQPR